MKNLKDWFDANGDNTLRLDYNLNSDSIVFDLGGYKGEWSEKIFNKYSCNIYIFEPFIDYFKLIENKFKNNNKIKVYNFGLSNQTIQEKLYIQDNRSSMFQKTGNATKINLKNVEDFLRQELIIRIDLMKINIEGAEYDVLEYLIKKDIIKTIDNIQIQFHNFIDKATERRNHIRELLTQTHNETYCYDFVWENWRLK